MKSDLRLDHSSPLPLYHQIVQAIRWRIGTGVLIPGASLPSIRDGADAWGVNYHTVRRAYQELAREGWVDSAQGSGTRVAAAQPVERGEAADAFDQWLDQVLAFGHERFGLSATTLAERILDRGLLIRVVMVERNHHQSAYLAGLLERTLPVEAVAWSLEQPEEPPRIPLIGTYFHHGEMRNRWPNRLGDMHFVALRIDPIIEKRIAAVASRRDVRLAWLVERDIGTAHEMATSVSSVLSAGLEVRPVVGDPRKLFESLPENELLLVAPRLWDALPEAMRNDERVFDPNPSFVPEDLQRVWRAIQARGGVAETGRAVGTGPVAEPGRT